MNIQPTIHSLSLVLTPKTGLHGSGDFVLWGCDLFEVKDQEALRRIHLEWIEEKLKNGKPIREDRWTESIAVGGEAFVKEIKRGLGAKAVGRIQKSIN